MAKDDYQGCRGKPSFKVNNIETILRGLGYGDLTDYFTRALVLPEVNGNRRRLAQHLNKLLRPYNFSVTFQTIYTWMKVRGIEVELETRAKVRTVKPAAKCAAAKA
jgi:hypothetical protein